MTLRSSLLSLLALVAIGASLGGCVAAEPKAELGELELVDGDDRADAISARLQIRGTLDFGASVDARFATRGHAGWLFTASRNARVVLDARGHDGADTVLYVYGPTRDGRWSRLPSIAMNDDYRGSLDSHVALRAPADGTYLAVVREYGNDAGSFTLSLACTGTECRPTCRSGACPTGAACEQRFCIRAPCPSFCAPVDPTVACETSSDCVAIPAGCCGCSMGGQDRAVNAAYADALRPVCDSEDPIACPAVYLCGAEQPQCVANRCEMVAVPSGECAVEECGPPLRAAVIMCEDGSLGGNTGRCLRHDDGSCGWELRECPSTDPTGTSCGGHRVDGPIACPEGFFCSYAEGDICGFADAPGTCQRIPEACIALYDPVCGCDGRTYGNACSANQHGISVNHRGECESAPSEEVRCGARLGDTCGAEQFCAFAPEAICGRADGTGVCQDRPTICTREYRPVCGCDGQTYSTRCVANAAGVSVDYEGACR